MCMSESVRAPHPAKQPELLLPRWTWIGSAGTPPITMSTVGLVTAVALGVAVVATVVPAVRAARASTVSALADSARPPRRTGWLIAISARLPGPVQRRTR
jgi:hypothetical protein